VARLLSTLFDLLRLRAGPQDLPVDRILTGVVIAVYVAQAAMTNEALGSTAEPARSLVSVTLQFGLVAAILAWRRRPERLQQTLLAFAATGTVIGLLAFFLLLQNDPNVASQPMLALIWFVIFGWSLAIDANIFRHALDITLPIAMLITVMLLAITYVALELMFP
jgi:hypothetical protein